MTAFTELYLAVEQPFSRLLVAAAALMMCAAASAQSVELPPPAAHRVELASEVLPILSENCLACHGLDTPQAGLSLHRLEDMIKGGTHGPAVIPGASGDSLLIQRVAGIGGPRMPMGKSPLSVEQLGILRAWIDQGAKWDGKVPPLESSARLAPRRPKVPGGPAVSNPIDAFVAEYFRSRDIEFGEPVPDEVFARRAYLDLWGLVPGPRHLDEFVNDSSDSKRAALVDRLLGDEEKYANHWISYWNDLLRNDEGVIYHGERKSITTWLFGALKKNLPYDEMVRILLNPSGGDAPEGFPIGVNWRGTVNASQTPAMQAAQNSAQAFLGINLKCASCHDSFVNQWKLRDSYGLAAMFTDGDLELVRCDVKLGETAKPKFLYPELGMVPAGASLSKLDGAVSQLVLDLEERGLLDRTLIVLASEFGRDMMVEGKPDNTVQDQIKQPDVIHEMKHYGMHRHFTEASSVLLFGGGMKKRFLYGKTADERPCGIVENPVTITDLHATIYHAMGIPANHGYLVEQRPFYVTKDGKGKPVMDLFA